MFRFVSQDFKKYALLHKTNMDYHEAMRMLEHRGEVKTAKELFQMIGHMDVDKNHRISFTELCCAYYHKSYEELFTFTDEDARRRALDEAMLAGEEAAKAEEEIEKARKQKELQAQLRAAALERESKLVRYTCSFSCWRLI
jgi:hypothetical protein